MPRLGVSCIRGKLTDDECRACMAEHNGVAPCHIPAPFLEMMRGSDGEPDHESFTPSRLLGCFRQSTLMSDPTVEWYTNVEHAWAMVRGTLIHSGIEGLDWPGDYYDRIVREVRMTVAVHTQYGIKDFSGKPDTVLVLFDEEHKVIVIDVWDWKTREFKSDLVAADKAHQMQVWMYAWLASHDLPTTFIGKSDWTVEVNSVNIAYISSSGCRIFSSLGPSVAYVTKGRGMNRHKEELPLEAIKTFDLDAVGRFIKGAIERKIRARTELPGVLEGDAAKWCFRCPVYGPCYARKAMEDKALAA